MLLLGERYCSRGSAGARLELELYRRYSRDEVIAAYGYPVFPSLFRRLGLSDSPRELCDGQWVIFPHEAICFANIGEWPRESHFETAGVFFWVGHEPYPAEVTQGHRPRRVIRLLARRGNHGDFLYLGTAPPSTMQVPGANAARFYLSPGIPSRLWAELRGSELVVPDPTNVDSALDRLRGPTTADDRFAILQTFVEYWYGPITPEDALPEEAIQHLRLPQPLRRWYRWAGRRTEEMFRQNFLLPPTELEYVDERLLFYRENQNCYLWSTLPDGDDPMVFGRSSEENAWAVEGPRLTEHLIGAFVFEAAMIGAPYGAHTVSLDKAKFDQIVERIPPLALPSWRYYRMRFYGRDGAFMASMQVENEVSATIMIGAKSERPLQFLRPLIDDDWEYVAI
jgi:hypothetical protein